MAGLQAELAELKASELSKRATADGCLQADIDGAVDSDNPKQELTELILRRAAASAKVDSQQKNKKTKKGRKKKEAELTTGQICCVISSTMLVLAATVGLTCALTSACWDAWVMLNALGVGIQDAEYQLPSDGNGAQVLTSAVHFDKVVTAATRTGQTTIVEFYAPWCGHCKELAPLWSRFADDVADHSAIIVAQVDCIANALLCEVQGVDGFPTIKHYNDATPKLGTVYDGPRDSVARFLNFASTLGPQCSHSRMELCDAAQTATIEGYLELSVKERQELIDTAEAAIAKVVEDFNDAVAELNVKIEKAQKERDETVNYNHDKEFTLLQVRATLCAVVPSQTTRLSTLAHLAQISCVQQTVFVPTTSTHYCSSYNNS
jgi:protein disulfide-isomerase-like protein